MDVLFENFFQKLIDSIICYSFKYLFSFRFSILKHNGEVFKDYRSSAGWNLIPFPKEKEIFYNDDNLVTANFNGFRKNSQFNEALISALERWVLTVVMRL